MQAVEAYLQHLEDCCRLWNRNKTHQLVALQLAGIKSLEVILQLAGEVPFASQCQHRTALVQAIIKTKKERGETRLAQYKPNVYLMNASI